MEVNRLCLDFSSDSALLLSLLFSRSPSENTKNNHMRFCSYTANHLMCILNQKNLLASGSEQNHLLIVNSKDLIYLDFRAVLSNPQPAG